MTLVLTSCPVSLAHTAVLAALHRLCFDPPWSESAMVELLTMPGTSGVLACVGEEPAGFVLWRTAADEAEILTILVRPDRRGQGLGDHLVRDFLSAARQDGAIRMFLEVADDNHAAQRLYARHGFTRIGVRRGYYPEGRDAYVLAAATDFPDQGSPPSRQ